MVRPSGLCAKAGLRRAARTCGQWLVVLAFGASLISPVAGSAARPVNTGAARVQPDAAPFGRQAASDNAREVAAWVRESGDNQALPFVIIDKVDAKVFVFDRFAKLLGAAPALLGLSRGDESVAGIGQRKLTTIQPGERTTPAGRFQASLGHDLEQDILWVDYETSLSLHRVVAGSPKDRRNARLASATPRDNRISYGCINVPAGFYDRVVVPAFTGTVGIVYILPESKSPEEVFGAMRRVAPRSLPTS
jgi:hypothetical protein